MRNVAHLVALSDPDDVPEVVLDDAEVIAVVVDVGGKEQGVATTHNALLAQIGRAPVNFQTQLVRLHDLRWLGKSLSKLCQERYVAVRRSLVIDERGVGQLTGPALGGALDERGRARVVPDLLRANPARDDDRCAHQDGDAIPHWGKLVVFTSERSDVALRK